MTENADTVLRCNKVGKNCHVLSMNNNSSSNIECRLYSKTISINIINNKNGSNSNINFVCQLCQEFLYKDCCVSLISNETSQEIKESKHFEIKVVNTSPTYNMAILINIDGSIYNNQRYDTIELKKYGIKDAKNFSRMDLYLSIAMVMNINLKLLGN